ncbi:MAG: glycosyltransferase [Succinivibrio sp.]|nr:glycosyltransferase [Succinivibrio sp.]
MHQDVVPPSKSVCSGSEGLSDPEALKLCQKFADKITENNIRILFLLDNLPTQNLSGLEIASFRRANLLNEYCGVEPWFVFNYYQASLAEDIQQEPNLSSLSAVHFVNLYDFVQDIDRGSMSRRKVELALQPEWKVVKLKEGGDYVVLLDSNGYQMLYVHRKDEDSLDYVNYIKNDHIVRRDTYDPLGFLSRTELFNPENNFPHTALFFRPDRTIALIETYRTRQTNNLVALPDSIHLLDQQGFTLQCFCKRDEFIAWAMLQLLADKKTTYICVADQTKDYQRFFETIKHSSEEHANLRILPVIHNCHTLDPLDVMNSALGDNYAFLADEKQRVDSVVTLTTLQLEDILKRYNKRSYTLTAIPHALPYSPTGIKDDSEVKSELPAHSLILIGRFVQQKNQLGALDLIVKVRARVPDATLHFYGSGGDEALIAEEVKKRNLTEVVFFHGFKFSLKPVYLSAALTLSLSHFEGFPLTILESLALGCPVVAFDCRYGPAEQIIDGENGYLLPYGDLDGAAACCVKLLADDALRSRFGQKARESVQRFSPQHIAALWAKLMTELLEK